MRKDLRHLAGNAQPGLQDPLLHRAERCRGNYATRPAKEEHPDDLPGAAQDRKLAAQRPDQWPEPREFLDADEEKERNRADETIPGPRTADGLVLRLLPRQVEHAAHPVHQEGQQGAEDPRRQDPLHLQDLHQDDVSDQRHANLPGHVSAASHADCREDN